MSEMMIHHTANPHDVYASWYDEVQRLARSNKSLEAFAASIPAPAVRPAGPMAETCACMRCGRRDGLDAVVPDSMWEAITGRTDGGGILCLWCIDALCAEKGIRCSATLHFSGLAVTGTSNSDADREHIDRVCAERDAACSALRMDTPAKDGESDDELYDYEGMDFA